MRCEVHNNCGESPLYVTGAHRARNESCAHGGDDMSKA